LVEEEVETMNELEKDAARYRYLRDTQNNGCRDVDWDNSDDPNRVGVIDHIFIYLGDGVWGSDADMMDESIDNAMILFPKEAEEKT
jgi:hypothetical protein